MKSITDRMKVPDEFKDLSGYTRKQLIVMAARTDIEQLERVRYISYGRWMGDCAKATHELIAWAQDAKPVDVRAALAELNCDV